MKAYELIDSPEKWTTKVSARDSNGRQVRADSPDACQFCIIGAINKVYGSEEKSYEILQKIADRIDPWNDGYFTAIEKFNDSGTQEHAYTLLKELDL